MQGRKEDGRADILISEDGLIAECTLYPSIGEGNALTPEYVRLLIEQAGITEKVDWETVNRQITAAQEEGKSVRFVIARGTAAVPSIPKHLKLKKRFFLAATNTAAPLEEEAGRVDFRSASPYTVVAKNEPVARRVDEFPGSPGRTVTGQTIQPAVMEVLQFEPGENLILGEDSRYRSAVDGQFVCKNNIFSVFHSLVIQGDIDLHTGHINFPGNVKISGGIKRGFNVLVTGNLVCAQTIEASSIKVGANLETAEGIIGYGRGGVKIGGELKCKFVENGMVECRNDIHVKDSIFNSMVYTLARVDMGNEGKILGGQIHAVNGISAFTVGNDMGLYGELHAGQNFVKSRELNKLKQTILRLGLKKDTLSQLAAMGRDIGKRIQDVEAAIEDLNYKIMEGRQAIDKNRDAKIVIHGTVFPGVLITICSATLYVREKMTNTAFVLEEDRIVTKQL